MPKAILVYSTIHFLEDRALLYTVNKFSAVFLLFHALKLKEENIQNLYIALSYTCVHTHIFLLWLSNLQAKMLTICIAPVIYKVIKIPLQGPEVQYLWRVEFQGRAGPPSSIAAS